MQNMLLLSLVEEGEKIIGRVSNERYRNEYAPVVYADVLCIGVEEKRLVRI